MMFFSAKEFECRRDCGRGIDEMSPELMERLNRARKLAGVPFKVNSAIRCNQCNKSVGGSPSSSHLGGLAVDIACKSSFERERILGGLIKAGFRRLGVSKRFIHADIDPTKPAAIWVYGGR